MTSKKKAASKSKKSVKSAAKKAAKVEDSKKHRIAVLIADDHSVVREGLASLIARMTDMTVVAEAAKLAERVRGDKLSRCEIDLLIILHLGKSNNVIGSALFISEGTVNSHVRAIFARISVRSRAEAVASATRRGLIQL